MSRIARGWVVGLCVSAAAASSWGASQLQSGVPRKAVVEKIGVGVAVPPSLKAKAVSRTAAPLASGAGSPVSFVSGQPAVAYLATDLPSSNDAGKAVIATVAATARTSTAVPTAAREFAPQPGTIRANMAPVSGTEAQRMRETRTFPANLNQGVGVAKVATSTAAVSKSSTVQLSAMRIGGDTSASAPASIVELARSLRNDPDLIYQYVRNNIEFYPNFGVQKGALGAVLDNQGTAYDQAALMVELLRASGYTASYVGGVVKLTAAQMNEWYGIDTSNVCGVLNLLGQTQVPVYAISAASAASCPGSTVALANLSVEHVWVKVNIGGTNYVFDPSYKAHVQTVGIDLASAAITGYDASTHLSSALNGATITPDYVQNINRTNIRSNLTTYANNLSNYLRANKPSSTLDDVIGGKTITPFYGTVRQTALPYQDTGWAVNEFTDIPNAYKPTLRIQYQGIDQTYTSDAIYGKRLSITYNASNQPVLKLDGVAVGSPGTTVATGAATTVNFTVTHNAYVGTWANHSFTQQLRGGGGRTFVIANGWGPAGRGPAENFRSVQSELRASGADEASEPVLGSTLSVIGAQWIAQTTHASHLTERLSDTTMVQQHQVGIVGYDKAAYVDLPSNIVSPVSLMANADKESAAFANWGMHLSILESTAVQQTTSVPAASTVNAGSASS